MRGRVHCSGSTERVRIHWRGLHNAHDESVDPPQGNPPGGGEAQEEEEQLQAPVYIAFSKALLED
jgi:hypothetical protein